MLNFARVRLVAVQISKRTFALHSADKASACASTFAVQTKQDMYVVNMNGCMFALSARCAAPGANACALPVDLREVCLVCLPYCPCLQMAGNFDIRLFLSPSYHTWTSQRSRTTHRAIDPFSDLTQHGNLGLR